MNVYWHLRKMHPGVSLLFILPGLAGALVLLLALHGSLLAAWGSTLAVSFLYGISNGMVVKEKEVKRNCSAFLTSVTIGWSIGAVLYPGTFFAFVLALVAGADSHRMLDFLSKYGLWSVRPALPADP